MPVRGLLYFLVSEFTHELRRDSYFAEMLWAVSKGVGMEYSVHYADYFKPKAQAPQMTGKEILQGLLTTW